MGAQALQRAIAAVAQGALFEGEQHGRAALAHDRSSFDALHLLGVVVAQQGRLEEAARYLVRALRIRPDSADAHCTLANVQRAQLRLDAAIASYRRAIALQPGNAGAYYGLAVSLDAAHRSTEAFENYRTVLALKRKALAGRPGDFLAHYRLSEQFARLDDLEGALACCRDALAIAPDSAAARGAIVMYQLAAVYEDDASVVPARARFAHELSGLQDWMETARPADGYTAFENSREFYLSYEQEDHRDLLSRYGDLRARTLGRWWEAQGFAAHDHLRGAKIRVGIVLTFVSDNPVWNAIVKGWVEHVDRSRFELHLFQIDAQRDEETRYAESRTQHVALVGKSLRESVEHILQRQLDVLIYPEVGMYREVSVLASLRLAPVQAASWGHPVTTGLPTIDHFLSAEDLEPPGAQEHYRERLVALPHLGCCYQHSALSTRVPELARLGIASDRPLLLCAGTPFKYAPRCDRVLVEIARRLGRCQLVFFVFSNVALTEKLRERLEAAFERGGLALRDHALFISWQDKPQFHALLRRADVHLDTIGFSGFNTAMQSIECGLPVVTMEGRFLRGRLASAILKRIGVRELVAATEEEYIELAVRLATDAAFSAQVRRRIEASRHVLFNDLAPVRALERFLAEAVTRG